MCKRLAFLFIIFWLAGCQTRVAASPTLSADNLPATEAPTAVPPAPRPCGRGAYVTSSSQQPDPAEVTWMAHFDIVHAGDVNAPLPPQTIAQLRAAGVQTLLAYDWMPAAYHYTDGEPDPPLAAWLYANRHWASLNPDGPFPHCQEEGYIWCQDYYYDLGNPQVRARRVQTLIEQVRGSGYDGIFFDWGSGAYLGNEPAYTSLQSLYRQRHPQTPYPQSVGAFYRQLQESGLLVQSNQGFRQAAEILPFVQYDMAESYGLSDDYFGETGYTVNQEGLQPIPRTIYYPLSNDPLQGRLEDTLAYARWLLALYPQYAGQDFRDLVYMNYAAPEFEKIGEQNGQPLYRPQPPRAAIYYGYALGKLLNVVAYTEVPWSHALERDPVYFYPLGKTLTANYQALPEGGYLRFYENGLALVGDGEKTTQIEISGLPDNVQQVYDLWSARWLPVRQGSFRAEIAPVEDPLTGRAAPSGRIFLWDTAFCP